LHFSFHYPFLKIAILCSNSHHSVNA